MIPSKYKKIFVWALISLIAVFVIAALLVQIPAIQTRIINSISDHISNDLGMDLSVEKVRLKFFKTVSLKNVLLQDQQNDTILTLDELDASLSLFSIWRKSAIINNLSLEALHLHGHRDSVTKAYNFQSIVDYFLSPQSERQENPWKFDIEKIKISNSVVSLTDEIDGTEFKADLSNFSIYLDTIDQINREIRIRQVGMGDSHISYTFEGDDSLDKSSRPTVSFPSLDWKLEIDQIRIEDGAVQYRDRTIPHSTHLSTSDLDVDDLHIFVDNVVWEEQNLTGEIRRFSFDDKSGFALNILSGKLSIDSQSTTLADLVVKTPTSRLGGKAMITYDHFGQLSYFGDSVQIQTEIDDAAINYKDLHLLFPGFDQIPYLNTALDEKVHINGVVSGPPNHLSFENLAIHIPSLLSLKFDGQYRQPANSPSILKLNIRELATSHDAIYQLTTGLQLPEGLSTWDDFHFSGSIAGNLDKLTGENIRLETSNITRFEGDFTIHELDEPSETHFDLNVKDLRSIASELQGFTVNKLPLTMDSLGQFYYSGLFRGTIYDFALDGTLASQAGHLKTNLAINFTEDFTDATYEGDLLLDSFDLGKVFSNAALGNLTMGVNIFGSGLDTDVLRATVLGEITDLEYNGYHYSNLNLDGRFDKKQFAGHASIEDPNIDFDFEGVVNFSDSLSRFRFKSNIDTINFRPLGLLDKQIGLRGKLAADFSGKSIDNLKGNILATSLDFSNLDDQFHLDTMKILSDFTKNGNHTLAIHSDLIKGETRGEFYIAELVTFLKQHINNYFKTDLLYTSIDTLSGIQPLKTQDFEFDWTILEAQEILGLFDPAVQKIDTVRLSGELHEETKQLEMVGYVKDLMYDDMRLGPITIQSYSDSTNIENAISVSNIYISEGVEFPYLMADLSLARDTAYLGILFEDAQNAIHEKLNLAARIIAKDDHYTARFKDEIILNNELWEVNPLHRISYGERGIEIKNLEIFKDRQSIKIQTPPIGEGSEYTSIFNFNLTHFEIDEVSNFLDFEDAIYDGILEGDFTLRHTENKFNYLADLKLAQLSINDEVVGDLILKSEQRTEDIMDVVVRMEGGVSGLDVRGTYNKTNSTINFQGEIDQLKVENLDPFFTKYLEGSKGELSGLVQISGTTSVPMIDGTFEMEDLSTYIKYLETRYTFKNEEIEIHQNQINLNDFTLLDGNGDEAYLNGDVDIRKLSDPMFNFTFHTDRFLMLNTAGSAKDLFYGTLILGGDIIISGRLSHPDIQVNAHSIKGTDFVLQPLIDQENFQQEDYIIFANPEQYIEDTTTSIQDLYQLSNKNIELFANIEWKNDAKLTIVVDPYTGDQIVCHGTGELNMTTTNDGYLNILGNYLIEKGQYEFNFQRVLSRTFNLEEGSRVNFLGDIMKSNFDITAKYPVRTSTYELIRNQSSLSSAQENLARKRSDIDVLLRLTGSLEKPIAKFDIDIEEENGSAITSSASAKLAELRADETAMNKQVFGLLIFNSFIAEEQSSGTDLLADAGQSAILSSVSNLLTNELNRLAKRYIKGVDLDFGLSSYSARGNVSQDLVTELEVGLSKRLLNDRLNIELGGNVQVTNNDNVDLFNDQNSTFSGDFVLEYKLTPAGNYNLKFYQVLTNENRPFTIGANYYESGASISFSKSFNSKKYQLLLDED